MSTRLPQLLIALMLSAHIVISVSAEEPTAQVSQSMETVLAKAGRNRATWVTALDEVPKAHRAALEFLLTHMPDSDLQQLKGDRILETIRLAYSARESVPWGKQIPDSVFFNDVLPYCNVDEPRDPWRAEFQKRFLKLAKTCKTPGEAAHKLNQKIFQQLEVEYSTKRKRANQSPKESMEQGLASCTGLSIILSNACRSVCVPARLAGIANWTDKRGNHTWVEVWDKDWHFAGAAEPSEEGLDHGWFAPDAARAIEDSYEHSIRAVSYERTKDKFPLVWNKNSKISAVNVTSRYKPKSDGKLASDQLRLRIRVLNPSGERIAVPVFVFLDDSKSADYSGTSRGESNDTNDILEFIIPRTQQIKVTAASSSSVDSSDTFATLTGNSYPTQTADVTLTVPTATTSQ